MWQSYEFQTYSLSTPLKSENKNIRTSVYFHLYGFYPTALNIKIQKENFIKHFQITLIFHVINEHLSLGQILATHTRLTLKPLLLPQPPV